jgi:hypothetical protein
LAAINNIEFHRIPSQFGNHYKIPEFRIKKEFNCVNQLKQKQVSYYAQTPFYNSPYAQLLNHHRSRKSDANTEKNGIWLMEKIKTVMRRLAR